MKKIILCIVALAACMTVFGQGRVFGVRAGLNVNYIKSEYHSFSHTTDSRASFHVGFAYQQPLLKTLPLYLETGLYLSGRGGTINDKEISDVKEKYNMLYLQIPASISWHFDISNISIQPLVGVYYGLGVYGKDKVAGEKYNLFKSTKEGNLEAEAPFDRSDFGMRFGVNVVLKEHYNIGLGYDLGLLNIAKDSDDAKVKNRSFFISLGYNF